MDSPDDKSKSQADNYLLKVHSNGLINWQFQTVSRSFCKIDIMNFPFDEQRCSISIRSSGFDASMIRIVRRNSQVKVMPTIKTEWFITDSTVDETTLMVPATAARDYTNDNTSSSSDNNNTTTSTNDVGVEFSVVRFNMKMRRVTTYYFLKIIFPFSIITSVTLFTFWLAPDSSEKLTLNVTVLLSLVIYLQIISEYIPRGFAKIPMLSLFSLTNFCLVYLSSVFSVLVLRLYYKLPSYFPTTKNELPYFWRLVLFKYIGPLLLFKFECRPRNESFLTVDGLNAQFRSNMRFSFSDDKVNIKKKKKKEKSSKQSLFNSKFSFVFA